MLFYGVISIFILISLRDLLGYLLQHLASLTVFRIKSQVILFVSSDLICVCCGGHENVSYNGDWILRMLDKGIQNVKSR